MPLTCSINKKDQQRGAGQQGQDVGNFRNPGLAAGKPDDDGTLLLAPEAIARQGNQATFPEEIQALQNVHGRSTVLRDGDDTNAALRDAFLLTPFDLLPVFRPQIKQQPHAGLFPAVMAQELSGDFPAAHMGHEDDSPPTAFSRSSDMLPSLISRCDIRAFFQEEPIQEDVNEVVILPPSAPQGVPAPLFRKKTTVKTDADSDTAGEK